MVSLTGAQIPLSGAQYDIAAGEYQATVTELGAGLRLLRHRGQPVITEYEADVLPPAGSGQLLCPWPNRVDHGRYSAGGAHYQLDLSEPASQNAIHGLTRWASWAAVRQAGHEVSLRHVLLGHQGYPFCLELEASYRLQAGHGLQVSISARNVGSTAAPYGTGSHPYLTAGAASIDGCELTLPAGLRLPNGERGIPAGPPGDVTGTEFDFRTARPVGAVQLDHAFTGLVRDDHGRATARLRQAGTEVALWAGPGYDWLQVFTGDALEPGPAPPGGGHRADDLPAQRVRVRDRSAHAGAGRQRDAHLGYPGDGRLAGQQAGEPGQVRRGVQVVRLAGVRALDQRDQVRVGAQERPGTDVARGQRDHLRPVFPGQQHRVARPALVGGDSHRSPGGVRGDQPLHRGRPDQRLVHQRDYGRVAAVRHRPQAHSQRGAHAGRPVRVVHHDRSGQGQLGGPGDHHDRVGAARPEQRGAPVSQPAATELDQGLRPPQPGPGPRGQQHPRSVCLELPGRLDPPPSLVARALLL